jgi:uncharacterized protein YbjT (DUF2867 family)
MKILVVGASGFIGKHLLRALRDRGHEAIGAARHATAPGWIAADYVRDQTDSDWLPRLHGIDVVVNCVGILRERGRQTFAALHDAGPRALFAACAQAGVRRVIQVSALGADERARSGYHRSKRAADAFLATLSLGWTIVRPSLVFGPGGASAALFSELAALPVIPLPGDGRQQVQPIHIDDLTALLVAAIESDAAAHRTLDAVGPRAVTLREWLGALRTQLGLGRARFVPVPMPLVRFGARVGARMPSALLDPETLAMLERGNVADPGATTAMLGHAPRPIERFIAHEDATGLLTDARLAWLLPLLRLSVALLWIATAIVSLGLYPVHASYAMLTRAGVPEALTPLALYGAAGLDFALGLGTLLLERRRWLWRAQIALIVGYSVIITLRLPEYWLHPFGPLTKNLPLLMLIVFLHEMEPR